MARQEYRRQKDHLDETGCEDAGPSPRLPGVAFVSVSLRREETVEGNVSADVNVNGTRDEYARVHGLRARLRHPSQQDAPRSSETAMIKVNHPSACSE